jgi:hypothetical protein
VSLESPHGHVCGNVYVYGRGADSNLLYILSSIQSRYVDNASSCSIVFSLSLMTVKLVLCGHVSC